MNDTEARKLAVNTAHSVIVQAPAGSGKTSLLVERYLGLLATVDAPEEILAVTFTKKAAAEMRERILEYLNPSFSSIEMHEKTLVNNAKRIRDRVESWRLLEYPQRLEIRTIDSLNMKISQTMPLTGSGSAVSRPIQTQKAFYREAVRCLLRKVDTNEGIASDIEEVLKWRDHRIQDVEDMLVSLLGTRDQWLRMFNSTWPPSRSRQESVLTELVKRCLKDVSTCLMNTLDSKDINPDDLVLLLHHAAKNLNGEGKIGSFIHECRMPEPDPTDLVLWKGLSELLLTQKGKFRIRIDKNQGFKPKTEEKDRLVSILRRLESSDSLRKNLSCVSRLPKPEYTNGEWVVLESICRLLKHSSIELDNIFVASGQTDFLGIAKKALQVIEGTSTIDKDVTVQWEWPISHLLVDEFQDTSWSQFKLIEQLTSNWIDDQTIFLVGDPMQSIYRFREAEVGLFIHAREKGIGRHKLQSVKLSRNFRSQSAIVNWVNDRIGQLFPENENIDAGAVAYTASHPASTDGGKVQTLSYADKHKEAVSLSNLLHEELQKNAKEPTYRAAIIVRSRKDVEDILQELKLKNIAYRAVDFDSLVSKPVVQDLLALTKVVLQPGNISAKLSLFRAPFCGLTLNELYTLFSTDNSEVGVDVRKRLTGSARDRSERIFQMLNDVRIQYSRRPIRDIVEGAWYRLGGPWSYSDSESILTDAKMYFNILDLADNDGVLSDWDEFIDLLEYKKITSSFTTDNVRVEILTMHGAKGLEYDLVILPGLNRRMKPNKAGLLNWYSFADETGNENVVMAPVRNAEEKENSDLIKFIIAEQKERENFEVFRLLYVAVTRAKKHLICSASFENTEAEIQPLGNSMLSRLWPSLGIEFSHGFVDSGDTNSHNSVVEINDSDSKFNQVRYRVSDAWNKPVEKPYEIGPLMVNGQTEKAASDDLRLSRFRICGEVTHRLLEHIAKIGLSRINLETRRHLIARVPKLLRERGISRIYLEEMVTRVETALTKTLESKKGSWILSDNHLHAENELTVAAVLDGNIVRGIVDRTFVTNDNTRWIIDYKSGYSAVDDIENFILQERGRYTEQLKVYWRIFSQLDTRPVRVALYLTLYDHFDELEF